MIATTGIPIFQLTYTFAQRANFRASLGFYMEDDTLYFLPSLKVVSSEKIGGSGVTSSLGTWYGGVVMGVLLSFN